MINSHWGEVISLETSVVVKLLICDDDTIVRVVLERMVRPWGYEIVTASSGEEAWHVLSQADPPRLVILDWIMPGMNGIEVCQKIKQTAGLPFIYVILLTSKSNREDIMQGLDAGADEFLTKPADPAELRRRLAVGARIVSAMPPTLTGGITVPGYKIIALLGEGSRGSVYHAVHLTDSQPVALKVIRADKMSEQSLSRFAREIELTRKLEHPYVVHYVDSSLSSGLCYLAMELVTGENLSAYVERMQLMQVEVLELVAKVCEGVGHAHERGIIHRDLKFHNVLITATGTPKVLDFGLAKTMQQYEEEANLTQSGRVVGTPAFLAPEQASGRTYLVGPHTDVYSIGVMLYRILLGHHPHDLRPPVDEMIARIAWDDIRPPRQFAPNIHPQLEAILLKALAKRPDQRYSSASELAKDLRELVNQIKT